MELNLEAPGKCWIDESKTFFDNEGRVIDKNGKLTTPKFAYDDEAKQAAEMVNTLMEDVETEFFEAAGSPLKGRAEYNVGPIWLH